MVGAAGGSNRLFCAQTQRATAAEADNRFHFVENGRPDGTNFQKSKMAVQIEDSDFQYLTTMTLCHELKLT